MRKKTLLGLVAIAGWVLVGCSSTNTGSGTFTLTSESFEDGGTLEIKYASFSYGDSSGRNPQMKWSNPPEGTKSYALIMDDPDAQKVVGETYVHWNVFVTDASVTEIKEGVSYDGTMPEKTYQGRTTSIDGEGGAIPHYEGPRPPKGETHNYHFCVYALSSSNLPEDIAVEDEELKIVDATFTNKAFKAQYKDTILGTACMTGKFTGR
jgi:Raf kinase inhibitor-like YbhB/YbcL family protein